MNEVIFLDNNLNENTINNIKNLVDNGDISSAISQISPEMLSNFSKLLSNSQAQPNNEQSNQQSNENNSSQKTDNNSNTYSNFDFSNIDMNTILKMKSIMSKMNNSNDPRSNLLSSLKPYLRDGKKEKLDQYANLLKMANVAELMKTDKKENNNNA